MGAASVSELRIRVDQYLIRNMTPNTFVRATRSTFLCSSLKSRYTSEISTLTGGFSREGLKRSEMFEPTRATPTAR